MGNGEITYNEGRKMKLSSIKDIDLGVAIYNNEKYIETVDVAAADWDNCPKCRSINIEFDAETDVDGPFYYRTHRCLECETTWEERYDMVQVKITEGEDVDEEDKS